VKGAIHVRKETAAAIRGQDTTCPIEERQTDWQIASRHRRSKPVKSTKGEKRAITMSIEEFTESLPTTIQFDFTRLVAAWRAYVKACREHPHYSRAYKDAKVRFISCSQAFLSNLEECN
jgi:hypothetical protein